MGTVAVAVPAQQPRDGGDHRQARPIQSSFYGLLHYLCLSAQGYARGERIPREGLHEQPGRQMSFWTARPRANHIELPIL